MKFFRLSLFLMCALCVCQKMQAGKYYSYTMVECKPTGAGLVYATTKTENDANKDFSQCKILYIGRIIIQDIVPFPFICWQNQIPKVKNIRIGFFRTGRIKMAKE